MGTGIALPADPPVPTTPGTPLPPGRCAKRAVRPWARLNSVVGLKSVGQLSLGTQISGFPGMTEVYNVIKAGNPNDQKLIPGND